MSSFSINNSYSLETTLVTKENYLPSYIDLSTFLYDYNLTYEIYRLVTDKKYKGIYSLEKARIFFRSGRPIEKNDRLMVVSMSYDSRLRLVTMVPILGTAISSVWRAIQLIAGVAKNRGEFKGIKFDDMNKHHENKKFKRELKKIIIEIEKNENSDYNHIISLNLPKIPEMTNSKLESVKERFMKSPFILEKYYLNIKIQG